MLDALLTRPAVASVTSLTTTITETNEPSWALFSSFARRHGASVTRQPLFERDAHFRGEHETEHLVKIAPLTPVPDQKEPS